MIIGICGLIGTGKDTIANYLVHNHDFTSISFADPLKDSLSVMFGWDRELLEGNTRESRQWREQPDEILSKEFRREITPRIMMQEYGTEVMRKNLHEDIWVILTKLRMINNPETNFVIPDVRFPNEKKAIKDAGGQLWMVKRGRQPSWWFDAIKTNTGPTNCMRGYDGVHVSEYSWVDFDNTFDCIIKNDDTVEELYAQIEKNL